MTNGGEEEAGRKIISDFPVSETLDEFSPWLDQGLEGDGGSHVSSGYSSCGESELDRYCSANSVLGAASFCSSLGTCNEFLDSDLWSLKNSELGSDHVLERFGSHENLVRNSAEGSVATVGRSLCCLGDDRTDLQNEGIGVGNGLPVATSLSLGFAHLGSRVDDSSRSDDDESEFECLQSAAGNDLLHMGVNDENSSESLVTVRFQNGSNFYAPMTTENHSSQTTGAESVDENLIKLGDNRSPMSICENNLGEVVHCDLNSLQDASLKSGGPLYGTEFQIAPEEDEETSSRYDHSGNEDSMYNGTDDECSVELSERRSLHYLQSSETKKDDNPLLINSTVAFGSDDWNEFVMQEIEECNKTSVLLDEFRKQQQGHTGIENKVLGSGVLYPTANSNINRSMHEEFVRDIPVGGCQVRDCNELSEDLDSCSVQSILPEERDQVKKMTPVNCGLSIMDGAMEKELQCIRSKEDISLDESEISESRFSGKLRPLLDTISANMTSQINFSAIEEHQCKESGFSDEDHRSHIISLIVEDDQKICAKTLSKKYPPSLDGDGVDLAPIRVGNLDPKESYDDFVLEMEEILLDSQESHGTRYSHGNRAYISQQSQHFRDGSSTASTSGTDDAYSPIEHALKFHGVEVVGAKQKKGDVSLGERLIGVKEYTIYVIRVWSGKDQWEVERRYRDFVALYRQLKTVFADNGWTLPCPWSRVERESRKIFGNVSPDVVSERSDLIQECLSSVLQHGLPYSCCSPLIWFLSSQDAVSSSSVLNTSVKQSPSSLTKGTHVDDVSTFGKTISLVLEIQPRKSMQQLLEAQHCSCAGCHKHLDAGKNLMRGFVQTLGWGKPRLCEYTGQLFCSSCHTNETAVLPARVLHFWDFTEHSVSQLAKSYLESIYDKPMLCVSAVNPFLFSKVPALRHVMGIRKKISAMVPFVHCPFRGSLLKRVGTRRYLLEHNEFFALRDLVDLSKAAFAALPNILETLSDKILEHITQRCLVCCDVGVPCGARQACEDPSALIFPFQEDLIRRCSSCELAFHKLCFKHLSHCPCGAAFEVVGKRVDSTEEQRMNGRAGKEMDGASNSLGTKSTSSSAGGFFSSLLYKAKEEVWRSKNSSPVILMGSLPNSSF